MRGGEAREKKSRDLRGVAKGLIINVRHRTYRLENLTRLDVEFSVVGAEVLRYSFGVDSLVERLLVKPDRERAHRPGALRLHERDDRRRVDPPRQKGAEWDVGDHTLANGALQQHFQFIDGCLLRALEGVGMSIV